MDVLNRINNIYTKPEYDKYLNFAKLHLDYINNNYEFKNITTDKITSYKYQGNLFALFNVLNIPPEHHVLMAYINGYNNPQDFDGKEVIFKLLPEKIIAILNSLY